MAWEIPPKISKSALDLQRINLSRMIARFHQILITPDSETEGHLRQSKSERIKLESNLAYAGRLLEKVEKETHTNYGISLKYEAQFDFTRKRKLLLQFSQQLKELNDLVNYQKDASDEASDGEYSLPDLDCEENLFTENKLVKYESLSPPTFDEKTIITKTPVISYQSTNISTTEVQSNIRARVKSERAELLQPSSRSTGADISSTAESLITHNRVEQEILTSSLLQMATMLKSSSQAFSLALEEETDVLKNATQGIQKNELGLEAAQRRMGLLRTMTEGKGWWGRIIMYAWIFALATGALIIVLLMPKLRF
ncbi:putative synaptobrevin protein [Erysiphe neolycopersici]|uniref:Putative synaptobrevin protein n=1 Tax=Erysiphe neolycopersici TaxID=212602 RepID=A0A420HKI1_9PEZI|nr:putative synaptobrevin protein [Erysiphe neolycopersici]